MMHIIRHRVGRLLIGGDPALFDSASGAIICVSRVDNHKWTITAQFDRVRHLASVNYRINDEFACLCELVHQYISAECLDCVGTQRNWLGVSPLAHGKWRASIWVNGNKRHIGHFDTAEAAARAYDRVAIEVRGDKAKLNFDRSEYSNCEGTGDE